MSNNKRKQSDNDKKPSKKITLSALEKKELCLKAEQFPHFTQKELGDIYGKGIKPNTVSDILRNANYWKNIEPTSPEANFKRTKMAANPTLESILFTWIEHANQAKITITEDILKEKAKEIAEIEEINDFSASNGWVQRFKKRFGLKTQLKHGEAGENENQDFNQLRQQIQADLVDYKEDNIFNADETALFWKLEPKKTLAKERQTGKKKSKDRVTIMLAVSATGEKLTPVFIHKFKDPVALRGIDKSTLPVHYYANSKGWMLSHTFDHWCRKLDSDMCKVNRKIVLLCDNATPHKLESSTILTYVKLVFLPPNTTTHLQPCDAGIIYSFKSNYRRLLCRNRIAAYEETVASGKELSAMPKFNIYDAIQLTNEAWKCVKAITIQHCWEKTGILPCKVDEFNIDLEQLALFEKEEEIKELESLILDFPVEEIDLTGGRVERMNIEEFISADDFEVITEIPSIQELIQEMKSDEEEEIEVMIPKVTDKQAKSFINGILDYIKQNDDLQISDELVKSLHNFEKKVKSKEIKNKRQISLDSFLNIEEGSGSRKGKEKVI